MSLTGPLCIPYPAVECHGIVGNGSTAALVAADGTIDWLCTPDFDGTVIFGALLDVARGGLWRVGPRRLATGSQTYGDAVPHLVTRWSSGADNLVLTDALLPGPVLVRRLHCDRGSIRCCSIFRPAVDFSDRPPAGGASWHVWASDAAIEQGCGEFTLSAGETVWLTCAIGCAPIRDTAAAAARLDEDATLWRRNAPPRARGIPSIARSAMALQLLRYQPSGAMAAAPTTSLPERIGGGWNVDYRLSWVRDTSLAMTALARLGSIEPAARYLEWLTTCGSIHDAPLQTVYTINGGREPVQRERDDVEGYRRSCPVRTGNHAYKQRQLDIFGYLADCALTLLDEGGEITAPVWDLLCRCADFVASRWDTPDRGIWEAPVAQRHTSTRVMCWVALDRTIATATRLRRPVAHSWGAAADRIRAAVLADCWNDERGAFTQAVGSDALDASTLLIPLYGLLPVDDPRVTATVERIVDELTIDGFVYRFDPQRTPGMDGTLGEFEAAFVPCTLWLASVYRLLGDERQSLAILDGVESVAGSTLLLGEAIDPRTRTFAGNFPLGFSHAERIRTAFGRG